METRVESIRPRFLNEVYASVYTGLTPSQLDHAHRSGDLTACYTKDMKKKTYAIEDLDAYMGATRLTKKPKKEKAD